MRKRIDLGIGAWIGLWCALPLLWCSCGRSPEPAIIWTDRPELAVYAEYFNASHEGYKIEVRYFENPAQRLIDRQKNTAAARAGNANGRAPDIVVASWLKSASSRALFQPLDHFFRNDRVAAGRFYPRLLSLGKIEGNQYLLPVSFNIPAIVFARENAGRLADLFTVDLAEIRTLGKNYNVLAAGSNGAAGSYTTMGFSPSWDEEFPFITATLFNTAFREAETLIWDGEALERSILFIRDWIQDANTGIALEDDFSFKYFFVPQTKLVESGRILFASLESSEFFILGEELRGALDFRWLSGSRDENGNGSIPLAENSTWYGICRSGRARKTAAAFTEWFFEDETQRFLMEESKRLRMNETTFGIAGGFSSLRTVTEQIFPQFYPGLLGHMPPEASLDPPGILPRNWMALKHRVILPYLYDQIRSGAPPQSRALEQQITNWNRLNQE
jgi:hypothetical protein